MTDKLYIISLGPGHPELITIQALKALKDCDVVFLPSRSKESSWNGSIAYKILSKIFETHTEWFDNSLSFDFIKNWDEKFKPIYTPMNYNPEAWSEQVELIASDPHKKVGFVTLGDAALYSSAYYLLDIIKNKYPLIFNNTEIIAGISSISYASALVKKPLCLGNTSLEIIPMHSENSASTKVYMRLHKGDDTASLQGNDLYCFENIGLDNEAYGSDIPDVIENYLTVIVDFAKDKK